MQKYTYFCAVCGSKNDSDVERRGCERNCIKRLQESNDANLAGVDAWKRAAEETRRERDEARAECQRLAGVVSDRNATLSRVALEHDAMLTAIEDALSVAENINTPYDPKLSPWCDLIAVAESSRIPTQEGETNG